MRRSTLVSLLKWLNWCTGQYIMSLSKLKWSWCTKESEMFTYTHINFEVAGNNNMWGIYLLWHWKCFFTEYTIVTTNDMQVQYTPNYNDEDNTTELKVLCRKGKSKNAGLYRVLWNIWEHCNYVSSTSSMKANEGSADASRDLRFEAMNS